MAATVVDLEPLAIAGVDLVWVIVGLVCLMFTVAGWVIFTVINDLFWDIGIFGFHPFRFVADFFYGIMRKEISWMDGHARHVGSLLYSMGASVWRFTYIAVAAIVGLWDQMLLGARQAEQQTTDETNRAIQAEQAINADLTHQLDVLQGDEILLTDDVDVLKYLTIPDLQAQVDALKAQGGQVDLAPLQHQLDTLEGQVNGLSSELQSAESTINTTINRDVADLTQQIGQATTQLQGQISNGVTTAEDYATGLVSGLGLGAITSTLTTLAGRLSKVEAETAECLDPLCDTVTPNAKRLGNVGNLFKALEDLGIEAAFIALAAECLTDPGAVVSDVDAAAHFAGDAAMAGFRDLIGV